jgi:hypothetical protein
MTEALTPVLDWHRPDEERRGPSQRYRLEPARAGLTVEPRSKVWKRKAWLDQRREGACTGFGAGHVLTGGTIPWEITEENARNFYRGARRYDAWAGEDYEGSSVHGVMDYLKKAKLISGYNWAESADELLAAIQRGPVELGTNVYTGWFTPDSEGVIRNTGVREGGHAYALGGIDLAKHRGIIWQSWGRDHGDGGTVYMDLDEVYRLLVEENGEAAIPMRRRFRPYGRSQLDLAMVTEL